MDEIIQYTQNDTPTSLENTLTVEVKHYLSQSLSKATKKAYASDLRLFFAWCDAHHVTPYPATPATIASFLASEAAHGANPITLTRRISAIRFHHEANSPDPSPTHTPLVQKTLSGIRRAYTVPITKKSALTIDKITHLIKIIPDTFTGKRDRALILLGFAAALRRSEITAIAVEDLEVTENGILLHIRKSKTDQESQGQTIAIPANTKLGVLEALHDWLEVSKIESGPIFRGLRRGNPNQTLPEKAMTTFAVSKLIKKYTLSAGLDPNYYSPHSLRSGFITSGANAGSSIFKIMEVSRHKKTDTVAGYVRNAQLFQDHAGSGFL